MRNILKNSGVIIYFAAIIILIFSSNSINASMQFNSNDVDMRSIYIGLFFAGIIYYKTG